MHTIHDTTPAWAGHRGNAFTRGLACAALALLLLLTGCFSEQSFPMNSQRVARFTPQQIAPDTRTLPARQWVARANELAASLLPADEGSVLTTDDLSAAGGRAVDVYQHFGLDPLRLDDVLDNFSGIQETARVVCPERSLDAAGHLIRSAWEGFHDAEVPGAAGVTLYARLSDPPAGRPGPLNDTCIVLAHGLFGSLDGYDMRNHAQALRLAGYRVLAVEMRGHGETQCRHPDCVMTFGVDETSDLVAVAQWLKSTCQVKRVGLISFSLAAYEGLLTAWLDGAETVHRFEQLPFLAGLPRPEREPAFNAGIVAVSAPVNIIDVADGFDTRYSLLESPIKATFEEHVMERMLAYHEPPAYSMWGLAESEYDRVGWREKYGPFATRKPDFVRFMDLKGKDWEEGVRRMENVRVPVLVLHAANDPLGTAQAIAELFSRVKNPNIGVLILPKGGHMAFSAYATDYYYTLLLNFFDPVTGPRAQSPVNLVQRP